MMKIKVYLKMILSASLFSYLIIYVLYYKSTPLSKTSNLLGNIICESCLRAMIWIATHLECEEFHWKLKQQWYTVDLC